MKRLNCRHKTFGVDRQWLRIMLVYFRRNWFKIYVVERGLLCLAADAACVNVFSLFRGSGPKTNPQPTVWWGVMADECVTREFDSACISSNVSIQLQYHVVRHVVCLTDGLSSAPVYRKRKIPNGCSLTSCQRTGNFSLSQTRYIYLDLLSHLLKSSHHTALVKTL